MVGVVKFSGSKREAELLLLLAWARGTFPDSLQRQQLRVEQH